jgi:hypothetical protein
VVLPGNTTALGHQDWRAFAADVYTAIPPGPNQEIIFSAAYYNYDFGDHNGNTGNGFYGELGYRYDTIQPFVSFEYFDGKDVHTADARLWFVGVNWWYKRINSLKLEFSTNKVGTLTAAVTHTITAQWQLFF